MLKGTNHQEKSKQLISEQHIGMLGKTHTEETRQKIREKRKKQVFSDKSRKKMSISHKGKINPNKGKPGMKGKDNPMYGKPAWNRGKYGVYSEETLCKMRKPKSEEFKRKVSGKNSVHWRGGISFEPYCQKFNNSLKQKIRERDNNTCQLCGNKKDNYKLIVQT